MIGEKERKNIDNIYNGNNTAKNNPYFNDNIESMFEIYLSKQAEYATYVITMLIKIDMLLSQGYSYDEVYEYIMEKDYICEDIDDDTDYFYRKAAVRLLKMRSSK